jgi:uncharacterized protein YbjT (DUF2867 family)
MPARPIPRTASPQVTGAIYGQRAHYSIDQFASSTAVPYSTIRPAIFSASLLAAAREVRASRTWTGLAGSGRMALIDHRDAAEAGLRVLTDPALWGAHHDLTGPAPMSWPEALELVSAELGERVTFRVAAERQGSGSLQIRVAAHAICGTSGRLSAPRSGVWSPEAIVEQDSPAAVTEPANSSGAKPDHSIGMELELTRGALHA